MQGGPKVKDKTVYLGIIIVNAAILVTAGAYLPVEDEYDEESMDCEPIDGEPVHFEPIDPHSYQQRRTTEEEIFIINDAEEYEQIIGSLDNETEINFEENSVIAVLLGMRPTGGYSVEIEEIREKDDKMVIHALESRPGDNCIVTMAVTHPYDAVLVENIEEETEVEICLTVQIRDRG